MTLRAWRSDRVILSLILLGGLFLRLWYLSQIVNAPDFRAPQQDPAVQDYHARAIVSGSWALPPDAEGDPHMESTPYFRPPGHAYFMSVIYFFTGGSYLAVRVVNMALGLGAVFLIYRLGRIMYNRAVGLIAAFLVSFYWGFIFWEGELNDPILFVFLLPALFVTLARWGGTFQARWAALAGIIFGCYALMRPNVLAFGPVTALWMLWMLWRREKALAPAIRRGFVSWCLLLAVTVACVAPVGVRNYVVSGEFVPISTYYGENLLIGNDPDADGVTPWLPYLQDLEGTGNWSVWVYDNTIRGLGKSVGRPDLTHSEGSKLFAAKAKAYMRAHPWRTIRLMLKKAVLFWTPTEITCNKVVHYEKRWYPPLKYLPGFPLVAALFALGLFFVARDVRHGRLIEAEGAAVRAGEMTALVLAYVLIYYLSFLPFFVNGRARIPIIPLCLLAGAYGLYRAWEYAAGRDYRKAAVAAAALAALWGLASIEFIPFEPDLARWHYQRADSYVRIGEIDKALAEAEHLLDMPEAASYMNMRLARSFAKAGHTEKAYEHFMAALRNHPDDPDVRVSGAQELIHIGKIDEGIAHYRETLRLEPDNAIAHNNLGMLLAAADASPDQARLAEALDHFRRAVASRPDLAIAQNNLGNLLMRLGRYEDAVAHFEQAIAQNPEQQDYHYNLAVNLALAGREEDALAVYRKAIELDPEDARAHNNLGLLLAARGQYDEAAAQYQEALRAVPDFVLVHANWGNMLADQGDLDGGIARYQKGLVLKPNDAGLHNGLGFLYARAGKNDEARRHYEEALRIEPDFPLALNNLGNLERAEGRYDEALARYHKALEVDPRDRFAWQNIGNAHLEKGRPAEAVEALRKAVENAPGNPDVANDLANALVRAMQFDEAERYYRRALELNPDHLGANCNYATVLTALQRYDEAIRHFERALKVQPGYPLARDGLDKARQAVGR